MNKILKQKRSQICNDMTLKCPSMDTPRLLEQIPEKDSPLSDLEEPTSIQHTKNATDRKLSGSTSLNNDGFSKLLKNPEEHTSKESIEFLNSVVDSSSIRRRDQRCKKL